MIGVYGCRVPGILSLSSPFSAASRQGAMLLALVLIAHAGENPTTTLSRPIGGNGLTLPAGARVLGPLPTQRLLHLIVGLSPRHQDVLQAFLALRSRSDGPLAHQSLTAGQFADLFSPTAAD